MRLRHGHEGENVIFVWTLGDVVGLTLTVIVGLIVAGLWLSQAIKEGRCKHDGYIGENRACDAICGKCGKNLGFIGAWRERRADRPSGGHLPTNERSADAE
jgi:hypothetical protein